MIPRLAPRRSRREEENAITFFGTTDVSPSSSSSSSLSVPLEGPSRRFFASVPPERPQPPAQHQRVVLSDKASSINAPPLSPSPSFLDTAHHLEQPNMMKSPVASDILCSDFLFSNHSNHHSSIGGGGSCSSTLTPPAPPFRQLVVSAKRLGQDVRRKHSSKRRRRRRPLSGVEDEEYDNNYYSSSSDEEMSQARAGLPFLFGQQPEILTPLEKTRHYWEWCYGKVEDPQQLSAAMAMTASTPSWSAKRAPPAKGCLSSNLKPRRTPNPEDRFQTPPASPEELEEMMMNNSQRRSSKKNFRVQFGSPQAAEYQVDGPPGQLTPMPSREARERYSMKDKHVTLAEEEITQETKQNSALLAEWEEELVPSSSRRKRNHHRRQKKNRRDSSVFVPSPIILAAVALEQQYNDNDHSNEPSCASSPSVAIMENLASLRMGSSPLSKEQESPETTMESSSSSLSPDFCCPPNHNVDTVEFRVNLESVNAIGGAMDTTPPPQSAPSSQPQQHDTPQRSILPLIRSSGSRRDDSINNGSSSRSAADTTPPPANVSLDTIHSVGGALDIESPANHHSTESTSPPASMMQLCCDETQGKSPPLSTSTMTNPCLSAESSSSSSSSSPRNSFEAVNPAEHIDIVQTLLQKPSADQEWDPVDVFRNLSKIREATKGNPVEKVLASIPPRQNGIIACVDDLLERAKYQASTKPPIPAAAVVKDKDAIQRGIAQEWKVLEEEFLLNVCQVVERTVETATTLCKRAETLKVSLCQNKTKPKRNQAEVLENEILDLQQKIRDKRDELKLLEASEAPSSALHCQASSHLGLFGFRLDCYTGNSLQLSFEHVVEGVESCFAFDLKTASLTASRITGATSSCQNPIPANHVAAKFHQYFLKTMLSNGTIIPLLPQVEPLELQETILALSRWLGRLDLAALDLAVISKRSSVTLDLPQVSIAFPNGLLIRASYDNDRNHLKQCFLPSQVFIKEPGQAERLHELPSDVTPGNCFQRIFETIA